MDVADRDAVECRYTHGRAEVPWTQCDSAYLAVTNCCGLVRKLLVFIEEYEMSMKSKLMGACDALLLAAVGAFQIGILVTLTAVAPAQTDAVSIDNAHVEVIVVEATKFSRG